MEQRSALTYVFETTQLAGASVAMFASTSFLILSVKWAVAFASFRFDVIGESIEHMQTRATFEGFALGCAMAAGFGVAIGLCLAYGRVSGLLPLQTPINNPGKQE